MIELDELEFLVGKEFPHFPTDRVDTLGAAERELTTGGLFSTDVAVNYVS